MNFSLRPRSKNNNVFIVFNVFFLDCLQVPSTPKPEPISLSEVAAHPKKHTKKPAPQKTSEALASTSHTTPEKRVLQPKQQSKTNTQGGSLVVRILSLSFFLVLWHGNYSKSQNLFYHHIHRVLFTFLYIVYCIFIEFSLVFVSYFMWDRVKKMLGVIQWAFVVNFNLKLKLDIQLVLFCCSIVYTYTYILYIIWNLVHHNTTCSFINLCFHLFQQYKHKRI